MSYFMSVGDDEIEMDPDYVGKGADPNVIGQPPPGDVFGALKASAGAVLSIFTPKTPTPATAAAGKLPAPPTTMDRVLAAGPLLLLVGGVAYFALKKKRS